LLGPNGAGKTTSFYMMVGLIHCDEGRVLLDERDLTHLPMHARARLGVGYLPQEAVDIPAVNGAGERAGECSKPIRDLSRSQTAAARRRPVAGTACRPLAR
jgi:ABC-type Na+ transport system ATPase subunit NatA